MQIGERRNKRKITMITNAQKTPSGLKNQKGLKSCNYYRNPWSEWRDSNPRPLHPQYSALPGCATLRRFLLYITAKQGCKRHFVNAIYALDN